MRPPARHPGRSRRVTSPTQPHGCQRRTAEGGTHRQGHSTKSLRQSGPPIRSAKLRPPTASGRQSRCRVSRPSDRKPSINPVRLAHSANPLRQVAPPSRAANQVRQAETANRQRSAKPPPSLPALGSEAVDESRSTRPHRHRTTPTHSAKLVRQAKGAKLRPPAAGEAAAGFQHSDRKPSMNPVRPAHSANPLRQPTPPTHSAKSLRQSGPPS
jgi:hypothetical protein